MTDTLIKQTVDPAERLLELIDRFDRRLARVFEDLVDQMVGAFTLEEISELIIQGRVDEALQVASRAGSVFADEVLATYTTAGRDTAEFLARSLNAIVGFDQTNFRAVSQMQSTRLRLVQNLTQSQELAIREALSDGISRGLNPRQQARAFRDAMGLTFRQVQAINHYRRLLETNSAIALQRALRDKRFDRTLLRAIQSRELLQEDQIKRMVAAYRRKYVKFRSETIARTESLRSVHMGSEEMYQQAVDEGLINPAELTRRWVTARDERVRGSHASMHGQVQQLGNPFLSGDGHNLRFPGDPVAPPSDTIQCRCVIATRFE